LDGVAAAASGEAVPQVLAGRDDEGRLAVLPDDIVNGFGENFLVIQKPSS